MDFTYLISSEFKNHNETEFGKTERCTFGHENKQFPYKSKIKLKLNGTHFQQCNVAKWITMVFRG